MTNKIQRPAELFAKVLLLTALVAPITYAKDTATNPHLLKPRTTSVSVFKNGMGFFTREGVATKRDGWVMAEQIPPAKFGTLAIYSLDSDEVVDVVGSGPGEIVDFDGVDVDDDLDSKRDRLLAAQNVQVQLTYSENRQPRTAAGKLLSVGPSFAILDTGTQSVAVPIEYVSRMQILQMPLRIHLLNENKDEEKSAAAKVGIAYLSEGITWIPEYTVKILDDTTAELTLRGTLVNEAEDLIHCDVNFVVGVPHFAHSQFMAPISVGQTLRRIGTAVAPTALQSQIISRGAIVSNYNTSDQFKAQPVIDGNAVKQPGNVKAALGNLPEVSGPGGNDFTVYTKPDMTIRRGERAIVTLFKQKIEYTHIYRWTPPGKMEHLLQLHNNGETAWTTGPYLAISGSRPLSEDLLKYTPRAGCCEIPMSTAVNIPHDRNEVEIARKLKAHSPSSNRYWDLVTLEGTLKVRNFEKIPVEIVISVPIQGKPTESSNEGELSMNSNNLKLLERTGNIEWTITLEPGQDKTLTYTYERFVSSH
jgi:hypothetical protein